MGKSKTKIGLISLLILIIGFVGYFIYKTLFPGGPNLAPVPNPIRDRATTSKDIDESNIVNNPLKNAYFGDLHIHTSLSFDAYIGGTLTTPSDAYRFAKGTELDIFGKKVALKRPLDFAGVSDHAEYIGEFYTTQIAGEKGYYALMAQVLRGAANDEQKSEALFQRIRAQKGGGERKHMDFFQGFNSTRKAWDMILAAAETHYQPGKFTTLAGYEWTKAEDAGHLHRNVFFRDMIVPDYPLSAIEVTTAEGLWESLAEYTKGGATVLAIPHNTNLGKGLGFPDVKVDGQPLDATYVQARNKWEPLIEIHQAKGNSEVHPDFWGNDEFANFENYNYLPTKENDYVRYALKKGLEYQAKLGTNPYKFGLMASTDTHNGTPGATEETEENRSHTMVDNTAENRRNREWIMSGSELDKGKKIYEAINPGGLVGVWAQKNTRGEIWDALKRKETFGTSGGRIQVRFFGGYDFEAAYTSYDDLVAAGYENGVPMGSDLPAIPDGKTAPLFLIWASKDNESANLDCLQVIKGWYKNGVLKEQIYTVALSDNRVLKEDGTVPDNGATVNLKTGEWSKDKGATTLQTTWVDPDFDPTAEAFYYVRVIELPTPRFNLWDEIREGIDYPDDAIRTIQERAWSSPIWYSPK